MTKHRFTFFILLFLISAGCSVQFNQSNGNTVSPKTENSNLSNTGSNANNSPSNQAETPSPSKTENTDNSSCYGLKRKDLFLDKKQTFSIDFKPFEKSCFVTFHDPEFDDPPLGSQFFVYKDGKEIFNFPQQFGGGNTACWVDAVSFEDLNNDQLKDVIVVGKCGGKSEDYNENMVYINTGKDFVTNVNSNAETMDFSKVGQIRDFVKKKPEMFSK